jgi:hypothetical protein
VADVLSAVLVVIKDGKPQAYVHPLAAPDICTEAPGGQLQLTLKKAAISSVDGTPVVVATFDSGEPGCHPRQLTLPFGVFRPAEVESYPHRQLKAPVQVDSFAK